ncbi:unnamed protein product [Dovyalis caffra]|uniref:Histone H2A n=1 Tax=Dovyalis caffra TaxID=77055 RepID=A0AAV1R394_9ROSI|nr:unnamed protein product [Dovyalis caffra]
MGRGKGVGATAGNSGVENVDVGGGSNVGSGRSNVNSKGRGASRVVVRVLAVQEEEVVPRIGPKVLEMLLKDLSA